jgi:hypothetical protein
MGYSKYNEDQIEEFISTADEMGLGPAIRYLGYPGSYHTAKKFYTQRGLDLPTPDSLAVLARSLGIFYSDKEKIVAAQAVLDRCFEKLMEDNLNSEELNKLSNAVHKAIQTINLIEGKSTNINENRSKDGTDLALVDMINEAKIKNNEMKERIINKSIDKVDNI